VGGKYSDVLDWNLGVRLLVEFQTDRKDVTDYAIVVAVAERGRLRTVRVYDGAHGHNEMHRYTREMGKRPGEIFHRGSLGEGMRTALREIKVGYENMIEGWYRG
jgi:hypothetical protein